MIVGAIGKILKKEPVDWKKLKSRFTNHIAKIESEVFHHYVFGIDVSPTNKDVRWYKKKLKEVRKVYSKKNRATYVDVAEGGIINPLVYITKRESKRAITEAFDALKAHWTSETISNPKLKTEQIERR